MKKFLIVIAVLLFVLLAVAAVWVQSGAFSDRIRPLVAGPLSDILGPGARIGLVKANLVPPFLEIRDIVLHAEDGKPAATIRKIKLYVNPVPLLLKKIRLPSIYILEPRILLERAEGGAFNITPLIERIEANLARMQGHGPSGYTLFLRTITVSRGELRFKDEAMSLQAELTGLEMTVRTNLAGDRVAAAVRGAKLGVSAPSFAGMTGTLKASAQYDRGRLRINTMELEAGDAAATLSGEMGLAPDSVLDLRGELRSGPRTLGRLADVSKQQEARVEASLKIKGKPSDPRVDGIFSMSGLAYGGLTLRNAAMPFRYRDHALTVSGKKWIVAKNGKTLVLDRIAAVLAYRAGVLDMKSVEATAGDLAARLQGTFDAATGFDARVAIESSGEGSTFSLLTAVPVKGNVVLEGRLAGPPAAPLLEGRVTAGPVTVRGVLFDRVRGELRYHDGKLELASVDIRRLSSRYVFSGAVDLGAPEPVYSARLKVIDSDVVSIVALFYKTLPLDLSASGELSFQGTAGDYSGSGYLALDAGSAYGETFTRGSVTARLTTGKITFPRVTLYKKKGMVKATGWIGFDGTYSAELEGRDIDLSAVDHLAGAPLDGESALDIRSWGSFSAPVVHAALDVSSLSLRGMALGRSQAELDLKDGGMTIVAGTSGDAVRASMHWRLGKPYSWTAEANVKTDGSIPVMPAGSKDAARAKVIAEGRISAHGAGLDPRSISGRGTFQRIALITEEYSIANESPAVFTLERGRLVVTSLDLAGPGTRLSVTGTANVHADVDLLARGTVNLPLLRQLFPGVEHAAGIAEVKLAVKDKWDDPDVSGEVRIAGGEIKMAGMLQKITALEGAIVFTRSRIVTESLSGQMGGGVLGISGWVQLNGMSLQDFSVRTEIDDVTVRYPEGLTSSLSGNLYFDGTAQERSLSGELLIKRARYDKPVEWKSMLVEFDRGLYQKKKTGAGWLGDTRLNIRLHGRDNIQFQNNLGKIPLDVDVIVRGIVNRPQLLGRIEASKGSVFFRKNDFKILHASVDFVDPNRINPVLDIQAETQVREYQIRLAVTGTAQRAVVTFISDPALADTDVLSLLALGKKSSELKGRETVVGVGEAASFATGQFQDILERRARSVTGLDRFQVDPYIGKSDTAVPRVTVGKELVQNKLFVTYSSNVGADYPEQIFRIEYILNRHFSVVGERNDLGNIGADFKYRFEFQ